MVAATLLDMCVMLKKDSLSLQQNGFNNKQYNALLKSEGEITSPKRLLVIAVLIGLLSTMAQSWIVVLVLAAVILAQAAYFLIRKTSEQPRAIWRSRKLTIMAITIAIIITGVVGYLSMRESETIAARNASITALVLLIISPALTMLMNLLSGPWELHTEEKN